jgi:NAD(P)-dependent dehydrogenase (short-subunit alcohol dehydrogenase family)
MEDKVVVVTGGASGIGLGIVQHAILSGARGVVLADLNPDGKSIASGLGSNCIGVECDVADAASVDNLVQRSLSTFGTIDVFVNSAGVSEQALIAEMDPAAFDRTVRINLTGTFHGLRSAGPAIARCGGGSIVNLASVAGMGRSVPLAAAYCASKAGVIALTQAAAIEFRELNVRVNAICPGVTITPLVMGRGDAMRQQTERVSARQGRAATPSDIAAATAFLVSDAASLITGIALAVDGGRTARFDDQNQTQLDAWIKEFQGAYPTNAS